MCIGVIGTTRELSDLIRTELSLAVVAQFPTDIGTVNRCDLLAFEKADRKLVNLTNIGLSEAHSRDGECVQCFDQAAGCRQ